MRHDENVLVVVDLAKVREDPFFAPQHCLTCT